MNKIDKIDKNTESLIFEKTYGSFKVMFVSVGEGKLLARVTDIAASWRVEWDEDTEMYTFLRFATAVDKENNTSNNTSDNTSGYDEYVGALLTVYYTATNLKFMDIEFLNSFADIVTKMSERNMKLASEEDDEKNLKELRTREEIMNTDEMKEFMKENISVDESLKENVEENTEEN